MFRDDDGSKVFLAVVVLVLLGIAGLVPLARAADEHVDRQRPMYADRTTVAVLQADHASEVGLASAGVVQGGQAEVGGESVTLSAGSVVTTRLTTDGFCVMATNDYGDATAWRCWAYGEDPATDPGYEP